MMDANMQLKLERDRIVQGLEETYRRLIDFKKEKKSPMIVLKDGQIAAVDPNDMPSTTVYRRTKRQ